jgi:ATP-binding cassette, subfamily C, bacterial
MAGTKMNSRAAARLQSRSQTSCQVIDRQPFDFWQAASSVVAQARRRTVQVGTAFTAVVVALLIALRLRGRSIGQAALPVSGDGRGRLYRLIPSLVSRARSETATAVNTVAADPGDRPQSGRDLIVAWRAVARSSLITVGIFSVFVNLLMLTIPVYLFQVSDRVMTSRSLDTLLLLTILAVSFLAVLSVLDILRRQVLGRLATQLETMLGGPVLAGLIGGAQTTEQGSTHALRSLHQVRSFIGGPVMLMLFDAPMAPLYFAAVFLVHRDLGIIAMAAGFILMLIAWANQSATAQPLGQASMHAAKADANAEALARNTQVINAMGMLNEGIMHWGREQARALTAQMIASDRNFWISGLSKFTRLITQIAMLGWGGYLALDGRITGGTMIAASIIAGRALQPIEGMIEGWRSVVQTRSAYARILMIIDALQNEKQRLLLPKPAGRLEVEKLLYLPNGAKEPVLNGIGFELAAGESLAILGPSGSGKSTLARILVGCLLPTAGRVRIDSTDLRNWDRRQFGDYTGFLPQEIELFPGTIKANICRMRAGTPDEDIIAASTFTAVHDLICRLQNGYETVLEGSGAPLSGGQKQRIALARAFFGNPALVVLDEPNANLDSAGEQALAETMQRAKQAKVTIIVITQRPALLATVDKVLVLRGGRQEAFGAPAEVLHRLVRPTEPLPQPATGLPTASAAKA